MLQTAALKEVAKKAQANGKEVDNLTDKVSCIQLIITILGYIFEHVKMISYHTGKSENSGNLVHLGSHPQNLRCLHTQYIELEETSGKKP